MKNIIRNPSAAAILFTTVIQAASAAQNLYLDASPAADYEWHATNLRDLGYQVTPYANLGERNGPVLRIHGFLTKVNYPEGWFGGYSVAVDLSYRCLVETKNLTGQFIATLGPITMNSYPYLTSSGNLNEPAFRQMASKTMAHAIENSDVLKFDGSRCAELMSAAPVRAAKPSKQK